MGEKKTITILGCKLIQCCNLTSDSDWHTHTEIRVPERGKTTAIDNAGRWNIERWWSSFRRRRNTVLATRKGAGRDAMTTTDWSQRTMRDGGRCSSKTLCLVSPTRMWLEDCSNNWKIQNPGKKEFGCDGIPNSAMYTKANRMKVPSTSGAPWGVVVALRLCELVFTLFDRMRRRERQGHSSFLRRTLRFTSSVYIYVLLSSLFLYLSFSFFVVPH